MPRAAGEARHPPVPIPEQLQEPHRAAGELSQMPGKREGAKGFIDKYADMSVHRDLLWGPRRGCRPPTAWVIARTWPCADPATTAQPSTTRLISANCAGGRERQRPASGFPSPGAHGWFPPFQEWHCAQGRARGWGQRRETAAASDPEQKTGVSTAGSTR